MGEQVEGLKDDPHPRPHLVGIDVGVGDGQIVEEDLATIDRNQKIDRLEQRRLSRTGRSDQTDHLVGLQLEVHVGEHREVAERLGEPDDPEPTRCLCHELIACRRRRTRLAVPVGKAGHGDADEPGTGEWRRCSRCS